ncbi:MAG: hypothetical protein ACKO96_05050 [Flammeovirgaceae bacterium]
MSIEELRQKAKDAGIEKWHLKSEERLRDELATLESYVASAPDAIGDSVIAEGKQVKAYFASGYTCYCSEAGLEKIKQQMTDFTHYEVV